MPTKPNVVKRITAWSYSRFSDFSKCPLMCRFKHVDKMREPDNEHQARGTLVHKEAELWSTGKKEGTVEIAGKNVVVKVGARIPKSLQCFKKEFDELRKVKRLLATEQQLGLDAKWEPTEWFDSDARKKGLPLPWCRVTMDCRYVIPGTKTMRIIDYKTGRVREENKEQLTLYGVAGFALDESIEEVQAELWYLDQGELVPLTYTREADEDRLRKEWAKKTKVMLSTVNFKPKVTRLCSYCHFRKSNGGPCPKEC